MIFTTVEECQQALDQININKNLIPPNRFDVVHEWFNINHIDYIAGGRANIRKPTGGGVPSRWMANLEQFNWIEKEEDTTWYEKIFPEEPDIP